MQPSPLRHRTLHKALEIVGSLKALSRRLRVPEAELKGWLTGFQAPPTPVFLEAVDIVVQYEGDPPGRDAPLIERRRRPRGASRVERVSSG
ncbi:MAG: hypothetical protein ACM30H_08340 [Clostridia bacterium]